MKIILRLFIIVPLCLIGCTENALFDDGNTAQDKHIVSGTLSLSDGASPENAYIWVRDLGVSSWRTSQGSFAIQIPRTAEYEGLNGEYTVYFYVGNYHYDTATVIVRNGQFEYGQKNITNEGRFDRSIVLMKMLDIKCSVLPKSIAPDVSLDYTIILELVNIDSFVSIITQVDRDQNMRGYFVKPLDNNSTVWKLYSNTGTNLSGFPITSRTVLETTGSFNPVLISAGHYEIIPFIVVVQSGLPDELLLSLGNKVNAYELDYLNVPYIRTPGDFIIE